MRRQVVNKKSVITRKKQSSEENVPEQDSVQEEKINSSVEKNSNENSTEKEKNDEEPEIVSMKHVKGKTGVNEPIQQQIVNNETEHQDKTINRADNNETEKLNDKKEVEGKKNNTNTITRCIIHKYFPWFLIILGITIGGYTIYRRFKK
jgi:hypothetical protein